MTNTPRSLCITRLDGAERALLWESEDPGPACVVVDDDGFIVTFVSEAAAREVADVWGIDPVEPTMYDLDAVDHWCRANADVGDVVQLLDAWNLLIDLPKGENLFRAADARALDLYDKLFRACNLPSMTPPGYDYDPVWTAPETAELKHLLLLGLAELRAHLR